MPVKQDSQGQWCREQTANSRFVHGVRTCQDLDFAQLALIHLMEASAVLENQAVPAVLVSKSYSGLITTVGFGVTTLGADPRFAVTWPALPVTPIQGQLEAEQAQLSTFCVGDSGGAAYVGRQRGCPGTQEAPLPHPLAGVTSYHSADRKVADAPTCQSAPIARFTDVAAARNRSWVCRMSNNEAKGC